MSSIQRYILVVTASLLCAALLVVPVAAKDDGFVEAVLTDGAATDETAGGGTASGGRNIQETIWFQGFLADVDTGDPINGTVNVTVRIYDAPTVGSIVWGTETHSGTIIVEGWFHIELGSISALPEFDDPPYYLELSVDGETMDARQKLASVPMAYHTENFDLPLQIRDDEGAAGLFGIYADNPSQGTSAIYAYHFGTGSAITGYSENSGAAIRGVAHGTGPAGYFDGDVEVSGNLQTSTFTMTNTASGTGFEASSTGATTQMFVFNDNSTGLNPDNDILTIEAAVNTDGGTQMIECQQATALFPDVEFTVTADGDVTADGTFTPGGADFAEMIHVVGGARSVEPGDVMVIDPAAPRSIGLSRDAQSTL
ncbi:hypothetical protein K8S17_06395, partial [bacterium]|nr:hypothetical protein [bacterium]